MKIKKTCTQQNGTKMVENNKIYKTYRIHGYIHKLGRQVGTRIHTSSWDAYIYLKLGRVYTPKVGTPSWDAYIHTSWDAYTHFTHLNK